MIFDRLCLGTANFGKKYNGVRVPESEQEKILDYCRQVGIDMIDTATAYEWDWTKYWRDFKIVLKVQEPSDIEEIYKAGGRPIIMAHSSGVYRQTWFRELFDFRFNEDRQGVSIYNPIDVLDLYSVPVIQMPYSLYDRRFEEILSGYRHRQIHVRSVFLRGRILKKALPHDCISFCLMNPYIDRVIIGVDSLEQLKQNLETFVLFDSLKTDDEEIIDPRKWKDEK